MTDKNTNLVLNINSILDYQEESIVSRVLLKEKQGNITLFAFDKGQELSEHTAPFNAMVHVVEGRAKISIAGNPYMLDAGDTIVMPANISHAVFAEDKFKMILSMIKK